MKEQHHYATVSEAISELQKQGYKMDFNLEENCIACQHGKFGADEFEIVDVYRYEGDSDPADEAVVYAIESNTGLKGILVTGYGISSEGSSTAILKKLNTRKN
jgi:cytochrome c peroxidase